MEVLKKYDEVVAEVRSSLRTNPHIRGLVEDLIAASKSNGTLEERISERAKARAAAEEAARPKPAPAPAPAKKKAKKKAATA